MRPQVILDGLEGLQPHEEVTAEKIIQWIIGALEVSENIPDFTRFSAGVVSRAFFMRLHTETAKNVYPYNTLHFHESVAKVADAVGHIFDATIEKENSLKCWIKIGQFLNDIQKHCKNAIFKLTSAAISTSLLKRMIAVLNFDANNDIVDSMLLCWKCGYAVAVANTELYGNRKKIKETLVHLATLYMNYIDEFFKLIGTNLIFSSDAFFPLTTQILIEGIDRKDAKTTMNYVDAVYFPLSSNDQVAKTNMAMFLQRFDVREQLVKLIAAEKATCTRKVMLQMLKTMLEFCRDKNIPFDIDWTRIFVHILYWHKDAVDLLRLEASDTEQDDEATTCNLIKRVVEVYIRHANHNRYLQLERDSVQRFMNLMKASVDFTTCEKLFYLLRKHVADSPAMCAVLILFIEHSAKTMAGKPHFLNDYVQLIKTTFDHIVYVKPYPELLSRLIKVFDLSVAKNDILFKREIMSIVPDALFQCDQYGTAVDLLEVLKYIGFDNDQLMKLFEKLLEQETTDIRTKETLVLFLAVNDVFDIFKLLNPDDRRAVYNYFKARSNPSDDVKVLYVSLRVHMLAAFHSTPELFPGEALNAIEEEATLLHQYLSTQMVANDKKTFFATHCGIAVCVYYTAFKPVETDLLYALQILGKCSVSFDLSYKLDAEKDAPVNDLRLLTKFWRCAIGVYKGYVPDTMLVTQIFEFYPRIQIHIVDEAEKFLSTILKYNDATPAKRYRLFIESTYMLVVNLKKTKVNPIVNKLLKFIERTESTVAASVVAAGIFVLNLRLLCDNFPRPKLVCNVQINLYKNHLMDNADHNRKALMDILNAQIDASEGDLIKCLEYLRNALQKSVVDKPPQPPQPPQTENDPNEVANDEMDGGDVSSDEEMNLDELSDVELDGGEVTQLLSQSQHTPDESELRDGSLPELNRSEFPS